MKAWDYELGNSKLCYIQDEDTGHTAMVLLPAGARECYRERRKTLRLRENVCPAWDVGSLCHLALRHHTQGNGAGGTLKYGMSTDKLAFQKQERQEDKEKIRIDTWLKAPEGYEIRHRVEYVKGEAGIEVETTFLNHTGRTVTLDLLTSFSLDNLSPFQRDDAPYKLKLHRFRGGWGLEGKHQEDTVEDLNLESSWFRAFPESERYGVRGSHPVTRWFPFGCVEDLEYHTCWAVQLGCSSSWQMEFSRDGDCFSLSGGIADCEFGSWWKNIEDGEEFTAPRAYISVSDKGFEDVCQNITEMFHRYADRQPKAEHELPIVFNEWCTTWGNPTSAGMRAIAGRLAGLPIPYLVIDAGWSEKGREDGDPQGGNGDWNLDLEKFPEGLLALSRHLRDQGFCLGIWMEFEVTTTGARVHSGVYDSMHLHRNGEIIETGKGRRFWDFRNPRVISYLQEKVIDFLRDNEIGYLKVDYNGSIGIGCDGAESPGEGLRSQMQAVYEFFCKIRRELPELIVENCASGGHRLEPSMMGITAMSVFSDAHECREIPYIAANLHNLVLPRINQVWAVLSPELSVREIQYRLASGMLGRMCLSGDLIHLDEQQWEQVKEAADFYQRAKEIIKYGRSRLYRDATKNQHYLHGAQVLVRQGKNGKLLLVCHTFADPPKELKLALPAGDWRADAHFGADYRLEEDRETFVILPSAPWEAFALLMVPKDGEEDDS